MRIILGRYRLHLRKRVGTIASQYLLRHEGIVQDDIRIPQTSLFRKIDDHLVRLLNQFKYICIIGDKPLAYDVSSIWNQGPIDITLGIAHAKAYSLSSCIVFDDYHFVHCDQNPIIGAGEARKRRMTPTSDGIGRTSNVKEADRELNFENSAWLEDTIWSQPSGRRPEERRFRKHKIHVLNGR